MGADSAARRVVKRLLYPLLNERIYRVVQAAAKAWDIRTGSWSEPELGLLPAAIRSGESALDVGANFGLYCYHLSRAVGPSGRVYAFEPVPFAHETCRLVGRLLNFRNVELINQGCSDRTGRVQFTMPLQGSGAGSVGLTHLAGRNDDRPDRESFSPYEETTEIWCDVVSLDEFLPSLPALSFIKSDIEGADLLALRGAARLIEQHRPTILCEISAWYLEGYGIAPQTLGAFFFDRGYRMYHYDLVGGHGGLTPATIERLGTFSTHNYVFVHPSRENRFAALLPASSDRLGALTG